MHHVHHSRYAAAVSTFSGSVAADGGVGSPGRPGTVYLSLPGAVSSDFGADLDVPVGAQFHNLYFPPLSDGSPMLFGTVHVPVGSSLSLVHSFGAAAVNVSGTLQAWPLVPLQDPVRITVAGSFDVGSQATVRGEERGLVLSAGTLALHPGATVAAPQLSLVSPSPIDMSERGLAVQGETLVSVQSDGSVTVGVETTVQATAIDAGTVQVRGTLLECRATILAAHVDISVGELSLPSPSSALSADGRVSTGMVAGFAAPHAGFARFNTAPP